ncbi:MAG TPA: hypothetical protein VFR90_03850 [Methylibium sp.]|uniref:hypothetical protein n=1 Tax=Methylibium sp. TaxID=2067992 RepID=UPI002DBF5492|nr:hypothetical protein [Methylibium sp.]HEU4458232.1 hypothetical protein [Methylibium sp.]
MDKVTLLKQKAAALRLLLERHQHFNGDARSLLETLTPLFNDIAAGKVVPPMYYAQSRALGKDHPFYEPASIFSGPHAEFACALEDWASQPWYAALEAQMSRKP